MEGFGKRTPRAGAADAAQRKALFSCGKRVRYTGLLLPLMASPRLGGKNDLRVKEKRGKNCGVFFFQGCRRRRLPGFGTARAGDPSR